MRYYTILALVLVAGCAGIDAHMTLPLKESIRGKRVLVYAWQDPYYGGRRITGVGQAFAQTFASELQAAGVLAEYSGRRSGAAPGYAYYITGAVTKWLDGYTFFSGVADVAAFAIQIHSSSTRRLVGSAYGEEWGSVITFMESKPHRFFEPLSEAVVEVLMEGGE